MGTITQKISNSKILPDFDRAIEIAGVQLNLDNSTFELNYRIIFEKDGQDVSAIFNQQLPPWHIDNAIYMIVRDENFKPILNRNFIEEKDNDGIVLNENERYLMLPAFDYLVKLILKTPIKLEDTLKGYIIAEDEDGRFNF